MEITVKPSKELTIKITLNSHITVLRGDSGSGKTYMANVIADMTKQNEYADIQGLEDNRTDHFLVIFGESEVPKLQGIRDKIIIIDNYDIYGSKAKQQIVKEIARFQNSWIIVAQRNDIPNYGVNRRSVMKLETEEKRGKRILKFAEYY